MLKTYHGSCHCGAVAFEADLDLEAGTGRCNCSICTKRRAWGINIKPDAFRLLQGKEVLSDYQFGTLSGHHRFCSNCGCAPFGDGHVEQIGGDYVSIAVNCLDDATPQELADVPVNYANGRDNLWWEKPAVTSYL
jgi:hypothetical protein